MTGLALGRVDADIEYRRRFADDAGATFAGIVGTGGTGVEENKRQADFLLLTEVGSVARSVMLSGSEGMDELGE
jgi:hypothetical protein